MARERWIGVLRAPRRRALAVITALITVGQFVAIGTAGDAGALSTNFFDYQNHDVATTASGLVDWANNGALTSANTAGSTWSRAGSQGVFNGGTYHSASTPPTPPALTAAANALVASGAIQSANFTADPISSDNYTCAGTNGPVQVSGDPTTFAGAGSETNNGLIGTFTYGTSGNTPAKDDLSNVYAVSHTAGAAHEIFFGGERLVNNGASHIDFEFLQASLSIPDPCGAGTMSGNRTQRDLLLSTDFTNGGALSSATLYTWSCNGKAPGAAGYDASKDFTVCNPPLNGNPGAGDPQYVAMPNGGNVAAFGVNTGANGITCGGWVCRDATGAGTTTLLTNELMEGGIDLVAAGFNGCINTFLPHTRTSPSFTSVLKDFAGPIAFSNCKTPTVTTSQSAGGATGANITATVPTSVTDTATLHGTASTVKGTIDYKLFSDSNCTQQVGATSTKTLNGTPDGNGDFVAPPSDAIAVNDAGTYYWTATYSGDTSLGGQNNAAASTCGAEVLTAVAPSLSITKTADAPSVSAGDAIGFTIAAVNNGQGTANAATISDVLPGGSGISWSISPAYAGPGTCTISGSNPNQTLSCALGNLAPGASASVHVTSSTVRASCGTYVNSATVAATNNDAVAPVSASTTVLCPDLAITKTADSSSVSAGTDIGFTITVTNNGQGTAKSVTLSDPLPTGSGIVWSISPANANCNIAGSTLSCSFGDLAPAASASVHVTSPTVFASCATYPNTASAQATNNPQVQASATTSVQCPGLNITKTADAATVSAGDPIGFTITVSNSGAGTATGVTLSDPLPGGAGISWSINPAIAGCSITGSAPNQTLNCSFGDMAPNASASVHVTSSTSSASCGVLQNTATATATNDGSVQASASITVNCPNLAITKTSDAPVVDAGGTLGFTITVTNSGPGTAKSATLNDPLPTGTGISWSISPAYAGPGTCGIASGALTCSFGDLAPNASASVHITSPTTVDTPCSTYTNTATAQATNNQQVQASASTSLQCPALHITKTADASHVSAGDPIGFTISVSNTGAGTASGVTLTDPLPGGAGIDWSISPTVSGCSISGSAPNQTLSCSFGSLASNATVSVHVTSATAAASCATYENIAVAAATNAPSVQASASTTVDCPNLAITKTADASSVSAGSAIGFTITVTNPGPGTAKTVTVSDPLPGGTGISWSISPSVSGCSITGSAPNQTLSCALGDLAPGGSATIHVTSPTTGSTPCADYPNTASAQASNNAQVQASATTSVQCPGLNIAKTADAPTVNAGEPIGFTVTVSNTGAGTATAVTVSDPLPGGTGVNWSMSPATAGCSVTGAAPSQTLDCSFGDMAPNTSHSVHITSPTAFASCATYQNVATASATNSASVQANASTTVDCPNLVITKTADASSVSAGDPIGFTITVGNSGTGTAKSVTIDDALPTGAGVAWTIDPAQAGCSISAGSLHCDLGNLAPGASASVHITSPTNFAGCATYNNTAEAAATNHPSVHASASTTVECPALSITKTADATPVNTGDAIGFAITVQNSGAPGTGTATSVTLSDPLPSGAGVSWSISPAYNGPGSCTIIGNAPNQTLTCSFGDMAPGASASVHIASATTAASAGTYDNTATAAASNHPAVQASASIVVLAPSLSITKTADANTVGAGDSIGFTITVANGGPGLARSVTMSDPLPSGNGVSWSISPAYAGAGTCTVSGSAPNQTLSCSYGDLTANESAAVHVTSATAFSSCGAYDNTASASATNDGTVTATATTTVQCPNLSITKTADDDTVSAGDPIGFTITVSNAGPATAKSVTVTDALPTGTGVDWSITPAVNGCSIAAGTLSCDVGDLAAQGSASVHISSPTSFASCAEYPNTATAIATNHPQVQANATTTVECPSLSITKTPDATPVNTGDNIGFTVTVSNAGPGTAKNVVVDDPLPGGSGVDWSVSPAVSGCSITGSAPAQTLHCSVGDLAAEASASVHIVSATTRDSGGTYDNTATATADNHPSVDASATVVVLPPALHITKVADAAQVNAGKSIGFTVSVSNDDAEGTGIARAVTLSDPLPSGGGVSWSISPAYSGPGTCSITGSAPNQTLECSFGDMAPGASASVHVTSATSAQSVGNYPNTAVAAATNGTSVQASATTKVIAVTPVTEAASTTVPPTTTTVPAPQPTALPFTGSASGRLTLVGFVLLAAGTLFAGSRRRRRSLPH